jgi:hypothetical protein
MEYVQLFSLSISDPDASPTDIMVGMFGNRALVLVDQVTSLLQVTPAPGLAYLQSTAGFNSELDYATLAFKRMLHLRRYLQGVGVPRNPDGLSFFDEEDNQDPLFCVKFFLSCTIANAFLSIDPMKKIHVSRVFFHLGYSSSSAHHH